MHCNSINTYNGQNLATTQMPINKRTAQILQHIYLMERDTAMSIKDYNYIVV